jgi:hypothetical protein
MDEFHFYAEPDRGWAWQVPLLELPQAQFLLMSATLGDVTRFEDDLTRRTGRPTARGHRRRAAGPADLLVCGDADARDHRGAARARPGAGLRRALHPGDAVERAQALMSRQRVHPRGEGRDRRRDRRVPLRRRLRPDPVAAGAPRHRRAPRRHAAEVPALVEQLAQAGCSRSSAAPTPSASASTCRSAPCCSPLSQVRRRRQRLLKAREFHQIAGRAGRAGYDTPARSWSRRPSTSSRTSGARQGRRRPEEAAQGRAQEAARGLRVVDRGDLRPARRRRPSR